MLATEQSHVTIIVVSMTADSNDGAAKLPFLFLSPHQLLHPPASLLACHCGRRGRGDDSVAFLVCLWRVWGL